MDPVETIEDLITNNYVLLRERLQVEKLIPHFIEKRLLNIHEDKQVVMSKPTTPDKAEALLELLTKKGTCKPEEFLEILKKGDHQHVADQLKRTSSQKETTEGASIARSGDNSAGAQGNEGSLGSSSDEESLRESCRLLKISEKIFKEKVLNDTKKLERRLLCFRQHVDDTMHFCKLSCKAKLRVKRIVRRYGRKVHRVVFSPFERELEQYDKIAKCFRLYSATLKKIEDGCVLCTLEFDDIPHLKSFLRGYRDGKLSETLTQELITEEMKQEGGPDLYVHVTLLVAKGSVRPDDEGSALKKTQHMPEDKEVQKTFPAFQPALATPGFKKSISRSLDDSVHAMQLQTHPVQKGTPQPGLSSLANIAVLGAKSHLMVQEGATSPVLVQTGLEMKGQTAKVHSASTANEYSTKLASCISHADTIRLDDEWFNDSIKQTLAVSLDRIPPIPSMPTWKVFFEKFKLTKNELDAVDNRAVPSPSIALFDMLQTRNPIADNCFTVGHVLRQLDKMKFTDAANALCDELLEHMNQSKV